MMLFVAEIGLNHNGNFDLACEMIRQAKLSGASIAKLQLGWKGQWNEINFMERDTLDKLFKYAQFVGIELMFSIFTRGAFVAIQGYPITRYKIASRTVVDDIELVKDIVKTGKETIISLGMWDKEELPIKAYNVKYLWCKSAYPSYPWDMTELPKSFVDTPFAGYSDHTMGIETALIAISRGAEIIEKHFTLDKSDTTIRDHVLSATPAEFKQMVELGTLINKQIRAGV